MIFKIEKGQEVLITNTRQRSYLVKEYQGVVTKIGRKFFYVDIGRNNIKFVLETFVESTDYSPHYNIWENQAARRDYLRRINLFEELRGAFAGRNNYTLKQLEEAATALGVEIED